MKVEKKPVLYALAGSVVAATNFSNSSSGTPESGVKFELQSWASVNEIFDALNFFRAEPELIILSQFDRMFVSLNRFGSRQLHRAIQMTNSGVSKL